jgi:glycosyltransferase involved in cell wall biosynthesis
MTRVQFVIPGDIGLPTGGYAYDRRVLALLPQAGIAAHHLELPASYPEPTVADLARTTKQIAATARDDLLLIDGLAYGAMPADLIARFDRRIVALVHHPLCLEAGITPARAAELKRLETEALAMARHVVVTSAMTGRTLSADFGVAESRITVAEPGTDRAARARGSGDAILHILAVGSVVPRKAYDVLIEALAPLKTLPWRLDIAGAIDRSPETVKLIERMIEANGFTGRIRLLGPVAEQRLLDLYDRADLFVLSSHYEGYGMVLAEALARGLPIVTTTGGAAADTVPDGAALKAEPGSPRALAWTLGRAIDDANIRKGIADAAWAAAQSLPRWEDTARRIAGVIQEVAR